MQNNNLVEQLYREHHDTLIEISDSICGKICNESEDMVQTWVVLIRRLSILF